MDEAQKWFSEGVALYEKGDYRRAITAFDKAIAIDPTMAEVWNNRGLALIQTEQYQEALQSINKALSLHPGYDNAKKAKRIVLDLLKEPENADTAPGPAASPPPQDPAAPERKRSKTLYGSGHRDHGHRSGRVTCHEKYAESCRYLPACGPHTGANDRPDTPPTPCRHRADSGRDTPSRHQHSRSYRLQGSGWRSSMTSTIQDL